MPFFVRQTFRVLHPVFVILSLTPALAVSPFLRPLSSASLFSPFSFYFPGLQNKFKIIADDQIKDPGSAGRKALAFKLSSPPRIRGPRPKGDCAAGSYCISGAGGVEFISFRLELRHNHHDRCILLVWYFRIRLFSSGFLKSRGIFYNARNCRMFCWQRNIEMPI